MNTHPETYQKKYDSFPAFFNANATYSAVPPKIATVTEYGNSTPNARIFAENNLAFSYDHAKLDPSLPEPICV